MKFYQMTVDNEISNIRLVNCIAQILQRIKNNKKKNTVSFIQTSEK